MPLFSVLSAFYALNLNEMLLLLAEKSAVTYILFILLRKSANTAQILIVIFSLLYGAAAAPVFAIFLVPLTRMYALLQSQKRDFSNEVLNLI